MDEISRVQRMLREEELCCYATSAKQIADGKRLPIIIAVISNGEEVAVLTFENYLDSWHVRDVVPVVRQLKLQVSNDKPLLFVLRLDPPSPGYPNIAAEALSLNSLRFFLATLTKACAAAREHQCTLDDKSHLWLEHYRRMGGYRPEQDTSTSITPSTDSLEANRHETSGQKLLSVKRNEMRSSRAPEANVSWLSRTLKSREAEFTKHETIHVFCGTWNVNGQKPSEALEDWLLPNRREGPIPDIFAIGFQELDLTAEALLLGDTSRAIPWEALIEKTLQSAGDFVLLHSRQLVGILLFVYVKREQLHKISDLKSGLAAVGIMGVMGNKGGVAIRFSMQDSTVCFVNSHLNAHADNVARRNQDYSDIVSRIIFYNEEAGNYYSVLDHELGDLNYRLETKDDHDVRKRILQRDFASLLALDQLKQQQRADNTFVGFQESAIDFAPTYKYDKDSTSYDSSDKPRVPSWCDRVLWRSADPDGLVCLRYSRHELLMSDHRPVSGLIQLKVKSEVPELRHQVYQQLLKQLDMMENECIPDAQISCNSLNFGEIFFGVPVSLSLTIRNTGQVMVRFRFIPKLDEVQLCKSWCMITPEAGLLLPGEECDIRITVYVKREYAPGLNTGEEQLEDIIVLHLENGKDYFVTLSATWMRSCFGSNLEALVLCPEPVRSGEPLPASTDQRQSIPKELWRLVDYIYRHGLNEKHIFLQGGTSDMEDIRECLDTGRSFAGKNFRIHSICETLMTFLESLSEPVIPFELYGACLEASHSATQSRQVVSAYLPTTHYSVFFYLMSFLREVLAARQHNLLTAEKLALVFSSVLLRALPGRTLDSVSKKQAGFIRHFLEPFGPHS